MCNRPVVDAGMRVRRGRDARGETGLVNHVQPVDLRRVARDRFVMHREIVDEHGDGGAVRGNPDTMRSDEHTTELQSLMRSSYAVFWLQQKTIMRKHPYKSEEPDK